MEAVQIGQDVTITVLAISADYVKLGIEAPSSWLIDRTTQAQREQHVIAVVAEIEGDIL